MSGGRKKSGFQITSVTSDYEQQEMPPAPGGENKSLASPKAQRGPAHADGAEPAEKHSQSVNGGAGPKNGPSAPSSPGAPPFQGPVGAAGSSRFRVVKLDQGLGEPSKRGRWTCLDFYDRDPDHHAAGRLLDSARHPHSLDSRLEVSGFVPKPLSPFSPQPQRRAGYLHSQLVLPTPGPSGHQARSLGGGIAVLLRPDRAPAGPASLRNPLEPAEVGVPAPGNGTEESAQPTPSRVPLVVLEDQPLPKSVAQLIQREAERKALPRDSRSRPSSPASPFLRDGSPHRRPSDPFGMSHAARLSLARSMFTMGGAQDSDDDSSYSSSMIAIDNKIEQAMDLVKSHLMMAVREEVEVLREQIKELSERNVLLEQENALLRSLASPEQLAQLRAAKTPPSGTS